MTLPYFPMYAGDWLSSTSVTLMKPEVEATYVRLLVHQWLNEGLPANADDLEGLTKLRGAKWRSAWQKLEPHFPIDTTDGQRRNERLEEERVKSLAAYDQRVEAGKKSAAARAARAARGNGKPTGAPMAVSTGVTTKQPTRRQQSESESETALPPTPPDGGVAPPSPPPKASASAPLHSPPTPDPVQLASLKAAALPHEAQALDVLLATSLAPWSVVAELHAIGCGLHQIRGPNTGRTADIADVMQATSELAANGKPFAVSLFRGYVKRIADRPPEPASADEREAAKRATEVQREAVRQFTVPLPPVRVLGPDGKVVLVQAPAPATSDADLQARRAEWKAALAKFRGEAQRTDASDPARETAA